MDWSWVAFGVVVAILGTGVVAIYRSARRWRTPPADLDTPAGKTLFWIRWTRGDRG
jgi:hypothetical protein